MKKKINKLVSKLDKMRTMHENKMFYCETRDIWNENSYYKNLSYYSPRIKALVNNGEKYEITEFDDIYYVFIETYVDMTGYTVPSYFGLSSGWAQMLKNKYQDGCDEKVILFIKLFSKCVSNISYKYITCVDDVIELDAYKKLVEL